VLCFAAKLRTYIEIISKDVIFYLGAPNSDNKTPLASLSALLSQWSSLAELGLVKTVAWDEEEAWRPENRDKPIAGPSDRAIYLSEVIFMFHAVSL
jgi:hypothetical protein